MQIKPFRHYQHLQTLGERMVLQLRLSSAMTKVTQEYWYLCHSKAFAPVVIYCLGWHL